MAIAWKTVALQAAGLAVVGLVVGVANNLTAGSTRRLDWAADYPDKKVKDCRKEPPATAPAPEPVPAAETASAAPPPFAAEDTSGITLPMLGPDEPHRDLSSLETLKAFQDGALFVDARLTAQYEEGHVQGALAIPVWEAGVDDKVALLPFEAQGDLSRPVVAYCNGGDCEDSHSLAAKIRATGFQNVYVYKDGWPDWQAKGRPSTKGSAR